MRHGDLLNLIYKHKRYCTATELSKDSERAGKMSDCSMVLCEHDVSRLKMMMNTKAGIRWEIVPQFTDC